MQKSTVKTFISVRALHRFAALNSYADDKDSWKHSTNFFNNLNNKKAFGKIQDKEEYASNFKRGYNVRKGDHGDAAHWTAAVDKDK